MTKCFTKGVFVRADGCIHLGQAVTCDGFSPEAQIRIQSHSHSDHLGSFPRSLMIQDRIVMSEATKQLLIADRFPRLEMRGGQIQAIPMDGKHRKIFNVEIALYPSAHMVGSAICSVKDDRGHFVYSGDFGGSIEMYPQKPDVLVIDATYGNPRYQRHYDQAEVIDQFVETACKLRKEFGKIAIVGLRGRLQFAAQLLHFHDIGPFLFSPRVYKTLNTYMEHSNFSANCVELGSKDSKEIVSSDSQYTVFVDVHDRNNLEQIRELAKIELSAFMVPKEKPIKKFKKNVLRVALTDHGDFNDTITLVRNINPKKVIADGSRKGDAIALAEYIQQECKTPATACVKPCGLEWGHH